MSVGILPNLPFEEWRYLADVVHGAYERVGAHSDWENERMASSVSIRMARQPKVESWPVSSETLGELDIQLTSCHRLEG
jgi:hypothetical protein